MIPYSWTPVIPLIIVHSLLRSVVATDKVYDIQAKLYNSDITLYFTDVSGGSQGNHPDQELNYLVSLDELHDNPEWRYALMWDSRPDVDHLAMQPNRPEIPPGAKFKVNKRFVYMVTSQGDTMSWRKLKNHIYASAEDLTNGRQRGRVYYFKDNPNGSQGSRQTHEYVQITSIKYKGPTGCGPFRGIPKRFFCSSG